MAKPNRIILIRHGQSQGNVDRTIYSSTPDYAVKLTEEGRQQAIQAGLYISEKIQEYSAAYYISPYFRTRETFLGISQKIKPVFVREDPRLREQEWSGRLSEFRPDLEQERDSYGNFYYRFDGGESCADVYDRMSSFFDTLFRDFEKQDFPDNAIIVSHGMTMRVLIMRWFHMTVEQFELLRNPKNCGVIILEKDESGKYQLTEPLEKYDSPLHPYQMPI